MTINIRNDRGKYIASIEIINDHVIEKTLNGCYMSDLDENNDGSLCYRLDINPPQKFIEGLSNETLLEEVRARMY